MDDTFGVITQFFVAIIYFVLMLPFIALFISHNGQEDYGFGTLTDKSMISTPSHVRRLEEVISSSPGHADYFDDLRMFSEAHAIMACVVDDEIRTSGRIIEVDNDSISYVLTSESKMQRGTLLNGVVGSFGIDSDVGDREYHLNIQQDGSLIFRKDVARSVIK